MFDLFANLDADDDQLDFPAHVRLGPLGGWADHEVDGPRKDLSALFELIVNHVPAPKQIARADEDFSMLATTLGADPFVGPPADRPRRIGPPQGGRDRAGPVAHRPEDRAVPHQPHPGLSRPASQDIDEAVAGDIVSIAGMSKATVADTICALAVDTPIAAQPIDPPVITVTFGINDSPLAGRDGKKVQSRVIRERLMKEAESNVAIRVDDAPGGEAFEVAGRGELQMGVLIENMRREGFELSISRPRVVLREDENGNQLEPVEEVTIDVDDEYSGVGDRKADRPAQGRPGEMKPADAGKTRIIAHVPSRGLIGYHGEFLTDTRGTGVLNRVFHGWVPHRGPIPGRRAGVLISMENGEAVAFALWNLEERGRMFIGAQAKVYQGMIIGEHNRENDLEVNPLKGKKLTNVRASGTDEAVRLTTPVTLSLEGSIAYIDDDELVEVTPNAIRLRKRLPRSRPRSGPPCLHHLVGVRIERDTPGNPCDENVHQLVLDQPVARHRRDIPPGRDAPASAPRCPAPRAGGAARSARAARSSADGCNRYSPTGRGCGTCPSARRCRSTSSPCITKTDTAL